MNFVFKIVLSINATSWMIIIYAIKENWTIGDIPSKVFGIGLLFLPVLISAATIWLTKFLGSEELVDCQEVSLADGEFLPVYLGYFFVSLGIQDDFTMIIVYLIVLIFTYVSQTQYFNPIFILFGYHYYHILTKYGTRIFLIKRGKVIRNIKDRSFSYLRRINDTTFIERR